MIISYTVQPSLKEALNKTLIQNILQQFPPLNTRVLSEIHSP